MSVSLMFSPHVELLLWEYSCLHRLVLVNLCIQTMATATLTSPCCWWQLQSVFITVFSLDILNKEELINQRVAPPRIPRCFLFLSDSAGTKISKINFLVYRIRPETHGDRDHWGQRSSEQEAHFLIDMFLMSKSHKHTFYSQLNVENIKSSSSWFVLGECMFRTVTHNAESASCLNDSCCCLDASSRDLTRWYLGRWLLSVFER